MGRRVFGESRTRVAYGRVLLPQARCVSHRCGRPETQLLGTGIRSGGPILRGLVMRRRSAEQPWHASRFWPLTMSSYPDRTHRFKKPCATR